MKEEFESVRVFGHSDDLVEVEGGSLSEEFYAYDGGRHLIFSEGTIIHAAYDPPGYEGKWKLDVVQRGEAQVNHTPAPEDDEDNYSDVVTLQGPLQWVECWTDREPSECELIERLQSFDFRDLSPADMLRVWRITQGRA